MKTLLVVLAVLLVLDMALARRPISGPGSPSWKPPRYQPIVCEPYWGAAVALSGCRKYEKCRRGSSTCGEKNCAFLEKGAKPPLCTADFPYRCFCKKGLWRNRFGLCVRKEKWSSK